MSSSQKLPPFRQLHSNMVSSLKKNSASGQIISGVCPNTVWNTKIKYFMFCISGEDQAEVQLVSNVNADTKILVPYTEALQVWLRQFGEDVMDQQVVKTDMKLRHIFNKAVEVRGCNNLNYFIISLLGSIFFQNKV